MSLGDIAKVLYRRWWVVVAVLLLTVGGVVMTVASANDEFEATATLLLASPELRELDEASPTRDGSALSPLVVDEIVEGDVTRQRLGFTGSDTDYTVTVLDESILRVEATSETGESVVETADAVIDEIERVVRELSNDGPDSDVTLEVLSRPAVARERVVGSEEVIGSTAGGEEQVEYFATGSVLLTIDEGVGSTSVNPYTASGATLRVLLEVADTESARDSILTAIPNDEADFEFVFDSRDVAPIVHVVARATSPVAAMRTLDSSVAFLEKDLADRQAATGAIEPTYLWYQRLSYADQAEPGSGNLRRPVATVLVLGIVAAISLAVLVDGVIGFRERRVEGDKHLIEADEDARGSNSKDRKLSATETREAS